MRKKLSSWQKPSWLFLLVLLLLRAGSTVLSLRLSRLSVSSFALHAAKASTSTSASASNLQGYDGFVRSNPATDLFAARCFHHVEFYCGDATTTYKQFLFGLGMELVAKSDLSTGNTQHASYALQSGQMRMLFTAPYALSSSSSSSSNKNNNSSNLVQQQQQQQQQQQPLPGFSKEHCTNFFVKHGLGIKAVAIEVGDVSAAYAAMTSRGGKGHLAPTTITDTNGRGHAEVAEVSLYGDVVLRLVNVDKFDQTSFWPLFNNVNRHRHLASQGTQAAAASVEAEKDEDASSDYGLKRFDHIVGNLWSLQPVMSQIKAMTGFHDFAEFVAEDVGTVDSGLNSVVLANNNEMVLLPLNEPTFGTKRKSQIQTYLEQNDGEGVQHMALFTNDIFSTMRKMQRATRFGGFEFVDPPGKSYYANLRSRLGTSLCEDQYRQVEELGLLADKDDQGVLLQVFTRPVGDRPTLFLEIIQRIGCAIEPASGDKQEAQPQPPLQKPGCGGFGKGNFKVLNTLPRPCMLLLLFSFSILLQENQTTCTHSLTHKLTH